MTSQGVVTAGGRVCYIEWMRALAAVAVVALHTLQASIWNIPLATLGLGHALACTWLQIALTRWAVPVFLMITGTLLLDPTRELGFAKIGRYVRRMLGVLATFGLAYCLVEAVVDAGALTPAVVGTAVLALLSGNSWDHMWYVYALVGIYLLTPAIRAFTDRATPRELAVSLVVLFALTLVVPTINEALDLSLTTLVWLPPAVFYYLLGHWASAYARLDARTVAAGLACLAIMLAGSGWSVVARGDYAFWLWFPELGSCFMAPWSLLVFLAGRRLLNRPLPRAVRGLARASFAVYLVHPIFLNALYKGLGWETLVAALPTGVMELAVFACALAGSLCLSWLLRRTPGIRALL